MRGSVRQRTPGSWTVQASAGFDDFGKRVRITRTVRGGEREAQRALTALLREVDQGTVARAGANTFGTYLEERWLPHMHSRVRPETWQRYESVVRVQIVPRCGRVKLAKLRSHHLQATLDTMLSEGAAPASVVKAHRIMASSLKQAVRWQLLATSPALGVAPPRLERPDLRIPDATEMRTIVQAAAHTPFGLPVLLAATTGLRRSEIVAVRWADVETEAGTLRVQRGKTSAARRTINLPPSMVAALKRHRKEQSERRLLCGAAWQDTDLLVDSGDGGPIDPDSLSHAFAAIAERVGLPEVRLHDLRHGFASALLKAGVNVKVVSEALGHSRSSFTLDVYAHVLPGMGEQVASVIETALGGTADG
jgi:integrase